MPRTFHFLSEETTGIFLLGYSFQHCKPSACKNNMACYLVDYNEGTIYLGRILKEDDSCRFIAKYQFPISISQPVLVSRSELMVQFASNSLRYLKNKKSGNFFEMVYPDDNLEVPSTLNKLQETIQIHLQNILFTALYKSLSRDVSTGSKIRFNYFLKIYKSHTLQAQEKLAELVALYQAKEMVLLKKTLTPPPQFSASNLYYFNPFLPLWTEKKTPATFEGWFLKLLNMIWRVMYGSYSEEFAKKNHAGLVDYLTLFLPFLGYRLMHAEAKRKYELIAPTSVEVIAKLGENIFIFGRMFLSGLLMLPLLPFAIIFSVLLTNKQHRPSFILTAEIENKDAQLVGVFRQQLSHLQALPMLDHLHELPGLKDYLTHNQLKVKYIAISEIEEQKSSPKNGFFCKKSDIAEVNTLPVDPLRP